jgi:hypothetical protein
MTAEKLGDLCNLLEEMGGSGQIEGAAELVSEVEKEFARLQDYFSTIDLHAPVV